MRTRRKGVILLSEIPQIVIMKKILNILLAFLFVSSGLCHAQDAAEPKTLFPYPEINDTIKSFEKRANIFVSKFWDNCNLSAPIKDKEGFESAFVDYVTFFRYAHKNVVKSSVNDLMFKAQSNMPNFWMIVDAAEKYLYSNEAVLSSDEAYMLFLNDIVRSSEVKKSEKQRYQHQIQKINSNQLGMVAPEIKLTDVNKNKISLADVTAPTVFLFFNDPDCEDCSLARLRLSTNVVLNQLIKENQIAFVCIYPGEYSKEWAEEARGYAETWIVAASEDADEKYDLRNSPTIYALDKDKKIMSKTLTTEDILNLISQ